MKKSPLVIFPVLLLILASASSAQTSGPARAGEPATRMVRSVSGTRGSEQGGRFVIDDPKNVCHLPEDKKVIVYFEWEGPAGSHHFEGQWKNPEGKTVVMSDFKFDTKHRRFGAYWELLLGEGMATGMWALEALVDGQPAGTHTFRIIEAPGSAPAAPVRRPLTAGEIYAKARAGVVKIEQLSASGEVNAIGSGFFVADDSLLTAFQVIDGAARLRVTYSDGQQATVSEVGAYERWQDWAQLPVPKGSAAVLKPAEKRAWAVGDRVFTLVPSLEGAQVIRDLNITGTHKHAQAGERLNLSEGVPTAAMGAPLLDEYGDVIAFLGGVAFPGAASVRGHVGGAELSSLLRVGSATAVPLEAMKAPPAGPRATFSDLASRGHFVPPVTQEKLVFRGSLSAELDTRSAGFPRADKEKFEYSRRSGVVYLVIFWEQPKEKRKAIRAFRVYDLDNKLLSESKPGKIDLKQGGVANTVWNFNVSNWPLGIYRIDVVVDGAAAWRGYLKVVD
jgi:hypothetical protein